MVNPLTAPSQLKNDRPTSVTPQNPKNSGIHGTPTVVHLPGAKHKNTGVVFTPNSAFFRELEEVEGDRWV